MVVAPEFLGIYCCLVFGRLHLSANPVVRPQNSDLREAASAFSGIDHAAVTKPFPPAHAYVVETLERITSETGLTAISSQQVSPWCMSPFKRLFDLACVIPALILLSPIMLVVAILVWITSEGPVLFRQQRVGLHRRTFTIYKFRTMDHNLACTGPCVTKSGDIRLTPLGNVLRKYKLDELPQLLNVLRGDMSLVGPRPKLPQHEHLDMQYRPGVTGAATLAFANEEDMLRDVPTDALEAFHVDVISPIKKRLDHEYQARATFASDFRMLVDTVLKRHTKLDLSGYIAMLPKTAQKQDTRSGYQESAAAHAAQHAEPLMAILAAEQAGD
jgi:lipopolysaccharide/colanic/teichoic acid biosynthesis glycosyltransferase